MYTRGDRRGDRRRDDRRDNRLVYTLQVTGRRDDRSDSCGDDRPVYTIHPIMATVSGSWNVSWV